MKKGLLLIMALLLALVTLSGCNLIGYDEALDGAQVVAKVNDHEITKAEWLAYRDYMAAYEQQYMQQYYGFSMPIDEETLASYGESALEQMIQSYVVEDKIAELGYDQLTEEETAEIDEYATSMADFYKMMLRYQNYPEIETVEEEAERLASAEGEAGEPVATITDAELDEMLTKDLEATGYTYEYFKMSETASKKEERIKAYAHEGIAVTDEEVQANFDEQVASQKEVFDATPSMYMSYKDYGYDTYYVPAGYRGVKHVLVKIDEAKETEIKTLTSSVSTAESAVANATAQLEELKDEDTAEYDAEAKAAYDEQVAALEAQIASEQAALAENQEKLTALTEEAFAEILPTAEEVLAKAQAGENFDELIAAYGEDQGMTTEPNKTTGYYVCEGLATYEQAFQDAAMALANVGDISDLVKTSYGYHILQYTGDIEAGAVEMTEEIKTSIHDSLLTTAQNAAYEAAVTEWTSAAKVETFPKIMK